MRACARAKLAAGCVTVKIRRKDFTTYTRQRHIEPATQETRVVTAVALELLEHGSRPSRARRCGCSASASASCRPPRSSICSRTPQSGRNRQLDAAVDDIRQKFGKVALKPASSLEPKPPSPRR